MRAQRAHNALVMESPGSSSWVEFSSPQNSQIVYNSKNRPSIMSRCMEIKQIYVYSETHVHTVRCDPNYNVSYGDT